MTTDSKFIASRRRAFLAQLFVIIGLVFFLAILSDEAFAKTVVVAVIDTGIDTSHKNLKNNIWRNQGEVGFDSQGRDRRFNGIDDDHNGYVDDYQGWNFILNNNDVQDNHGHGSHVSGLILGSKPDSSSENSDVQIMALKYYDSKIESEDTIPNTVKAIQYAIRMKADVINYSGGGYQPSLSEQKAIQEAKDHEILFVAASGNDSINIDKKPFYPASYGLKNIISVGSGVLGKGIDFFSNYGIRNVNIMAAGEKSKSTLPNSEFGTLSGTSQAAAMVSHVVAELLATQNFGTNNKITKVKERLFKTGPPTAALRKMASEAVYLNEERTLSQRNEFEDAQDVDMDALGAQDSLFLASEVLKTNFKNYDSGLKN